MELTAKAQSFLERARAAHRHLQEFEFTPSACVLCRAVWPEEVTANNLDASMLFDILRLGSRRIRDSQDAQ